jgi:hypothetical protein
LAHAQRRGLLGKSSVKLLVVSNGGQIRVEPITILDRSLVKRKNQSETEILAKLSNLVDDEASSKHYAAICVQLLFIKLEDKLSLMGGVLSCTDNG